MIRTIYQRLCQLLRSLLGRGGSDHDDQAEQETDHADAASKGDADRDGDDRRRPGRDGRGEGDDRPDVVEDDSGGDQADGSDEDDQEGSEGESPTHSGDEDSGIPWPPQPCIETPHLGEGAETIEIRLYHRAGDDAGEFACRAVRPWVRHAFEEAWGTDYRVSLTIHPDPVPASIETHDQFDGFFWALDSDRRANHANCLIFDEGGVSGSGGEWTAVVNAVQYFRGSGFDPETDCVTEFGDGALDEGINRVIHEIGHSLGLSHDGDPVEMFGNRYIPPMRTSYDDGHRYYHQLHDVNRAEEPDLSSANG
jgi:hypothetical protein